VTSAAAAPAPRGIRAGLVLCVVCGRVSSQNRLARGQRFCRRCGAPLAERKPDSLRRTWAFLIAATALYFPANLLPIMHRSTLVADYDNTILNGVLELWEDGAYDLAIIVFTASIVVPLLKIGALLFLLITVHWRSKNRLYERARLYRIVEFIGQWSMLDVFVVALLVALVHFRSLAEVAAGSGAIAFGGVVLLTMLASQSFDSRLLWDAAEGLPLHDDDVPVVQSLQFGTAASASDGVDGDAHAGNPPDTSTDERTPS